MKILTRVIAAITIILAVAAVVGIIIFRDAALTVVDIFLIALEH